MTVRELELVIKTAKNFIGMDNHIVISDSRDGVESHFIAKAELVKTGPAMCEEIILTFSAK